MLITCRLYSVNQVHALYTSKSQINHYMMDVLTVCCSSLTAGPSDVMGAYSKSKGALGYFLDFYRELDLDK